MQVTHHTAPPVVSGVECGSFAHHALMSAGSPDLFHHGTVSATTVVAPNDAPRRAVNGAVFPAVVTRAPGEPFVIDLRPGNRCSVCLLMTSVVAMAVCAVFAVAFLFYRVAKLEERVRVLDAAMG
jgi:hypothetical protein